MAIEKSGHVLSQSNQKHAQKSGAGQTSSRKVSSNHGNNHTMGWESRKWPIKETTESPLVKENSACLGGFTFEAKAQENEYSNRAMGNFSKGQGDSNWRQNNRRDSEGSNGDHGLVRRGGSCSLEEHLPPDRGECSTGLSTHGGRGMDENSKPILAFSHGQTNVSSSNKLGIGATRESLLEAPLRRINECFGEDLSGDKDLLEENPSRETGGDGSHGKFFSCETSAVFNANDSMHSEHTQQAVSVWDSEARCESISGTHQGKNGTETSMDIEGERGGTIPGMV